VWLEEKIIELRKLALAVASKCLPTGIAKRILKKIDEKLYEA